MAACENISSWNSGLYYKHKQYDDVHSGFLFPYTCTLYMRFHSYLLLSDFVWLK